MNRILLILLFSVAFHVGATTGKFDFSQIRSVYITGVKNSDRVELVRLFKNGVFEHLIYQADQHFMTANKTNMDKKFFKVDRNIGTYKLSSGELTLKAEKTVFISPLYKKKLLISNNKVYENRFIALFKKDQYVLRSASRTKYGHPYFLDPETSRLVTNQNNLTDSDLDELSRFLISGSQRSDDKIEAVWNFVQSNLLKGTNHHGQNDRGSLEAHKILLGENRTSDHQGFSIAFNSLLQRSGFKSKVVSGKLRNTFTSSSDHSWNAILIGNTWVFYDLFMGESWKGIHPELMIHSHFPDSPDDQHISEPISLSEFNEIALILPNSSTKNWINAVPRKGIIDVGNSFTLQYNGYSYPAEITITDMLSNIESTPVVKQFISNGRVTLEIPVNSDKSQVRVTTTSGIILEYILLKTDEKKLELLTDAKKKVTPKYYSANTNAAPSEKAVEVAVGQYIAEKNKFLSDLEQIIPLSISYTKNKLIQEAIKYYGISEIPGNKHNKDVLSFFKLTDNKKLRSDEVAWCSVFMAVCAKNAGLNYTNSPLARSWLNIGEAIEHPEPGDIVIFWREQKDSYQGHVAIWLGETEEGTVCLGGNQDDSVCIRVYDPNMILGYRRLSNR